MLFNLGIGVNKAIYDTYVDLLVTLYTNRVTDDGGIVEAKSCLTAALRKLDPKEEELWVYTTKPL